MGISSLAIASLWCQPRPQCISLFVSFLRPRKFGRALTVKATNGKNGPKQLPPNVSPALPMRILGAGAYESDNRKALIPDESIEFPGKFIPGEEP